MGILSTLREAQAEKKERIALAQQVNTMSMRLEESASLLSQLEHQFAEDQGWDRIGRGAKEAFSQRGRRNIAELCRAMHIVNPLIKRGLAVRAAYVWGQGVGIQGREEKMNDVVQAFLDDPGNRKAFTGAQAHITLENQLGTDGNVFLMAFSNKQTGFTQVRTIDPLEITDQVTNPEDVEDPWFYRRDYAVRVGENDWEERSTWYPAIGHQPAKRDSNLYETPIDWSAHIYHVKANPQGIWGLPDAFAALAWAKAYKEFLEDWAALMKALSRIAWRISGKKNAAQQARRALADIDRAGQGFAADPSTTIEAVPKTGATIDSESGRPLATMVAAALGIPVTTLMSDPGQTGARAVAETLNQPTRLEFQNRQELWTEAYRVILNHAIDQAVLAPSGPLQGSLVRDSFTQQEEVVLRQEKDRTIVFTWPDLDEQPVDVMTQAIAAADASGKMPPLETMRLLLRAFKVRDVDEIIEEFTDDDGNFIDPNVSAADAAVGAFERGKDPADAMRRARRDEEDEEDGDQQ